MYQLVVADFFKTLVDADDAIPISTMIEIDRLRQKNVFMVMTTSKDIFPVLDYNRDFPFIDYIISFHGAYLYDVNQGCAIFKEELLPSILQKLLKMFSTYLMYFFTADRKLVKEDVIFDQDNIYQVEIHCSSKKELHHIIQSIKRSKLKVHLYQNMVSGDYWLDVISSEVDVASSAQRICQLRSIASSSVVAFGSDISDLALFEWAGFSVAMAQGPPEVKKVADMVTYSNCERGFQRATEKLF